jgi:DNA-binding MarR family transcriptional regulator
MTSTDNLRELAIDRFWETVPPLWGTIRSHIRSAATGNFDISVEQFHILRHVRKGIGSISELATAKNISRPAVSQAVEALVKKGLDRKSVV